jgi:hypothetical protein
MLHNAGLYYRAVQFPVNPSDACWESIHSQWTDLSARGHITFSPEEHISDWLQHLGIKVLFAEAFYTPPHFQIGIHRDGRDPPGLLNRSKINWIRGGAGKMIWYETVTEGYEGEAHVTEGGTLSRIFPPGTLRYGFETVPHSPCLLNVGRPHKLNNNTPDGRWCLSYTLGTSEGKSLQWQDAINILNPWIVDNTPVSPETA